MMVPGRPSRHCDNRPSGRMLRPWQAIRSAQDLLRFSRSSKGDFMTIDLTRRTLLHLAGASSLGAAAVAAAQAEGAAGGGPTFANRTPMRIGMVTLRVRDLDKVTDYYRDALGLTVMQRSATSARLGSGGVALLDLERREGAAREARNAAGLYHTAFLMPTRKDLARWLVHAAKNKVPLSGFRSPRQRVRLSRRSRRQRHRGLCRPRARNLEMGGRLGRDGRRPARHRRPAGADGYAHDKLCQGPR